MVVKLPNGNTNSLRVVLFFVRQMNNSISEGWWCKKAGGGRIDLTRNITCYMCYMSISQTVRIFCAVLRVTIWWCFSQGSYLWTGFWNNDMLGWRCVKFILEGLFRLWRLLFGYFFPVWRGPLQQKYDPHQNTNQIALTSD